MLALERELGARCCPAGPSRGRPRAWRYRWKRWKAENGRRRVGREEAQAAQKSESDFVAEVTARGHSGSGRRAKARNSWKRWRAENGRRRGGREEAQEAQKSDADWVTEVTARGHRGSRRRAKELNSWKRWKAENGRRRVGREEAQAAQKSEADFVTEATARGHRGSRRRAKARNRWKRWRAENGCRRVGPRWAREKPVRALRRKVGRDEAQKAQESEGGERSGASPFPRLAPAQRLDAFSSMSGRRKTEADGAREGPAQRGNGVAYCVDFRR